MRSIFIIFIFSIMLAAGPPLGQSATESRTATEYSGVTLPPELDRVLRDYERAWSAGDAEALASLFAENGFVLQRNGPPVRGRSAIQAYYRGHGGSSLRLRAFAFSTNDTVGYIIGAYGYENVSGDIGKFTLTLHRSTGEPWLIFSDMDNSNLTPNQAEAPNTDSSDEE